MDVRPFRAIRPRDDLAARIASYPYDVVNAAEARELAADDPDSFLHVVRAEIDLEPEIDSYDPRVYAKARENLDALLDDGRMAQDEAPAYYVYRLTMDGRTQTGVLAAAAVDDYRDGSIRRHEHTRPEKEDDRVRLNTALEACPGPVFLTYRGLPELNAVIAGVTAGTPRVDFTAADGIRHELWVVDDKTNRARILESFGRVPHAYVADGHHRAAAAARVGAERVAAIEKSTGDEPAHFFLAAYFPSDQLHVLDYNRVVRDLNGLDAASFLDRLRGAGFHVKPGHQARRPTHRHTFGVYLDGEWHLATALPEAIPSGDVVRELDVAILSDRVLQPILGIGDPRTDKRIDFVGGIRGMDELERRIDSGRDEIAFALYPTSIEDVMSVADAGKVMPPKSTWFEPKLRSGLVVQSLSGDRL